MTEAKAITRLLQQHRRFRRRAGYGFTLNLAPMMDVMFNLLVFFLVATSFTLPEGLLETRLPRTTGLATNPGLAVPVVPIKIFLEPADLPANERIRVGSSLQADTTTLTVIQNFEDLYGFLADVVKKPGYSLDTPIIVAAKPRVSWDQVVNAYNAALRAKYKNVVFASWK